MPTFICEQIFNTCIAENAGNATGQALCEADEKEDCGHLHPAIFVAPAEPKPSIPSSSVNFAEQTRTTKQKSSSRTAFLTSSNSPQSSRNLPSLGRPASASGSTTSSTLDSAANHSSTPTSKDINSDGLSTGGKAGIGIGVILGIIILIFLGWELFMFGKRSATRKESWGWHHSRESGIVGWTERHTVGFYPLRVVLIVHL